MKIRYIDTTIINKVYLRNGIPFNGKKPSARKDIITTYTCVLISS